jgi:hypothetical protein
MRELSLTGIPMRLLPITRHARTKYAVMRTAPLNPFVGEEVANHDHRQLEFGGRTGTYSSTVGGH